MDHFCPWMNNSIGARNQKHFFLFLIYTDTAAVYALALLAYHFVDCEAFSCNVYETADLYLVRVLLVILLFAVFFTSSMLVNQIFGVISGIGTIDRMKLRRGQQVTLHYYKRIPCKERIR
jgi:palmitoyltransferase ZDHHC3/7/25